MLTELNKVCPYHGPENWCAECLTKDHSACLARIQELEAKAERLAETAAEQRMAKLELEQRHSKAVDALARMTDKLTAAETQLAELRGEVLEWFCGRAGDYIKHEHYEKLLSELESLLPDIKEGADAKT